MAIVQYVSVILPIYVTKLILIAAIQAKHIMRSTAAFVRRLKDISGQVSSHPSVLMACTSRVV